MRFDRNDLEEGLLGGILAAIILLFYVVSCLGCSTTACPPCVPIVETITVLAPVDACEPPEQLPTLEYPQWPEVPQTASGDALKAFYADVAATIAARERIFLSYIAAQKKLLDAYR
jgi:hypothetical protein